MASGSRAIATWILPSSSSFRASRLPALPVAITDADGQRHDLVVALSDREQTYPLDFDAEGAEVTVDPDQRLLVEQER